jgi:predicted ArsR family transcriptional regulator
VPAEKRNDARRLGELLAEHGRHHLRVFEENGALVVSSLSREGREQKHFRLAPDGDAYQVEIWDRDKWRKAPIAGSLERCVDQLAAS